MKKTPTTLILLLLSTALTGTSITANADPNLLPQTEVAEQVQGKYVASTMKLVKDFCPPVQNLVRNPLNQTWAAPNGWKTTSPSLLRTVDSFVGAQWVGVSVGEIICIYTKATRSSFPVTLQRGKLVPSPTVGGLWSGDKGGYMECKSNDIHNCPFFTQIPKPEQNVYDQLDFYKGKPTESN